MSDDENAITWRQHYQTVSEGLGQLVPELANEEEIPYFMQYIWEYFQELNMARGSSGFGPSTFTYTEIDAWARLTDRKLEPWEVKLIKNIDTMWVYRMTEKKATRKIK